MKRIVPAVIGIALLIGDTACNRSKPNKAEQSAALDNAYRSGILSKEEYDAKKAASLGPPAVVAPVVIPEPVAAPAAVPPVTPPSATAAKPKTAPPIRSTPKVVAPTPSVPIPAAPVPAEPKAVAPPVAPPPPAVPSAAAEPSVESPAPLAGCEDKDSKPGKEKGVNARFFPMPPARVKKAAATALANLDFTIHKTTTREIEASRKRHIGVIKGSGGERVTLEFQEDTEGGKKGTLVLAETKKSVVLRAGQKSWTNAILAQIACALR